MAKQQRLQSVKITLRGIFQHSRHLPLPANKPTNSRSAFESSKTSKTVASKKGKSSTRQKRRAQPIFKRKESQSVSKRSKVIPLKYSKSKSKRTSQHGQQVHIDGEQFLLKEEADDDFIPEIKVQTEESATQRVTTRSRRRALANGGTVQEVTETTEITKTKRTKRTRFSAPGLTNSLAKSLKPKPHPDFKKARDVFYWDWTPWIDHPDPDMDLIIEVHDVLAKEIKEKLDLDFEITSDCVEKTLDQPLGPLHAASEFTIHSLVNMIMSQATDNDNAIMAKHRMCDEYPYWVNGKKIVGQTPNYHAIRTGSLKKLQASMRHGGLHNVKAMRIKAILDLIFKENQDRSCEGLSSANEPCAEDFVPGALSLDYLRGKSAREIYSYLIELPGVNVKTAHCFLSFVLKYPIFAVDVHCMWMPWFLGWIPEDVDMASDRILAASHLNFVLPDELKYALHQLFWHHRQHCKTCEKRKRTPSEEAIASENCVLEDLVVRRWTTEYAKKLKARKSQSSKRKAGSQDLDKESVPGPKGETSPTDTIPRKRQKKAAPKSEPYMLEEHKMTGEQAVERGYELRIFATDDDFAVSGNVKKRYRWFKTRPEDGEAAEDRTLTGTPILSSSDSTIVAAEDDGSSADSLSESTILLHVSGLEADEEDGMSKDIFDDEEGEEDEEDSEPMDISDDGSDYE